MRSKLLLFLTVFIAAPAFAADLPNAVFVLHNSGVASPAFRRFEATIGKASCDCLLTDETVTAERLKTAKLLFMEHPSEELLARLKPTALEAIRNGLQVVVDVPEIVQRAWEIDLPAVLSQRMLPYWQNGGEDNMVGFFLSAYQAAGGPKNLTIPPVQETPKMGVYHPDSSKVFANLTDYLTWYRAAKPQQGPLAVVNFFATYLNKRDLAFVDALLRELEKQGLAAAGVFGWPISTLDSVFVAPPNDPPKVLLTFTLGLPRPDDPAFLEKLNVHAINLFTTPDSYEVWSKSNRGVTPVREASSLGAPERDGASEPIVVATNETGPDGQLTMTMPISERVEMAAKRAKRWIVLNEKVNAQKRIAILYYNNPPGKGNIGASYMNVAPSIRNVLETLGKNGYNVGSELPSAERIIEMLERVGRNIEAWAPGELDKMVQQGAANLLPIERYKQWFAQLPQQFRDSINQRWGKPEDAQLMTWTSAEGKKYFVIPGIRFGNVFLGPQLLRASAAEYTNVQQSSTLPPHHAYVASYLYYRHQFQADAVIHMGRHGTLEWLPGKNAGQAGWDTSEVLLGDLPNIYYYIMDGDGEAIQALRRSAAVEISHLTPMLARAGSEERFHDLDQALQQWDASRETSPMLANEYAIAAQREIERLGLAKQLGIENQSPDEALPKVEAFLESVEEAPMPIGLATLGVAPSEQRQRAGLLAYLQSGFSKDDLKRVAAQLPAWSDAIFAEQAVVVDSSVDAKLRDKLAKLVDDGKIWIERLRESPDRELNVLPKVLRGEFLTSGPVGDPMSTPDALPSGRNLHQGDPNLIPTPAAWEVGKKLAGDLLDRYLTEHGRYPERISMILWQGETGRHQGAMESEALYLMGVEPEWNQRGAVDRLKLIPDSTLGRPRVNVVFTVSGLYRDAFAEKIFMLDRAARMAAAVGDNAISRQTREVKETLLAGGVAESDADELAGARVFTTAPGSYGFGLSQFVEQSRDKDEPKTMADLYLSKMNFVYSEKTWGRNVPNLLKSQLKGNESILHSRSSNLYGAVDGDDVYQWMGGLNVASKAAGANPEMLFNNLRKASEARVEDARSFIATELNARNWNPKWISELQKEGYAGARQMMTAAEYLYGWQATAPETISPTVWQKMYDVYVADQYELGLKKFFETTNPAAKQVLVARLLEVDRQGTYRFSSAQRAELVKEYVQLVSQFGVACSANVCGNRRLQSAVYSEAQKMSKMEMDSTALNKFRTQFQQAARKRQHTVTQPQDATPSLDYSASRLSRLKAALVDITSFSTRAKKMVVANPLAFAALGLAIGLLGGLVAYGKRRPLQWSQLEL